MNPEEEYCSHLNAVICKCTHSLWAPLRYNPSVEKQVMMVERMQLASPPQWSRKDWSQGNRNSLSSQGYFSPNIISFNVFPYWGLPWICPHGLLPLWTLICKESSRLRSKDYITKSQKFLFTYMVLPRTTSFQHRKARHWKALSCWYQFIPSPQLFYQPFQVIFTQSHNCQQVCSVLATLPFVSVFHKNSFVWQSNSCALFFNVPSLDPQPRPLYNINGKLPFSQRGQLCSSSKRGINKMRL